MFRPIPHDNGEAYLYLHNMRQVPSIEEQLAALDQMRWLGDHVSSCLTCKHEIDPAYGYCGCPEDDDGPMGYGLLKPDYDETPLGEQLDGYYGDDDLPF